MKKVFVFCLSLIMLFSVMVVPSSALTVNSTYSDVASTSSQANNLINLASSYDDFMISDFVVFCDSQNSYYIVWGDLELKNDIVSGVDVKLIHYYRSGNTGTTYSYVYSEETSFGLNADHICTSNIDGYGFKSSVYSDYKFQDDVFKFLIFLMAFIFIIAVLKLRGGK